MTRYIPLVSLMLLMACKEAPPAQPAAEPAAAVAPVAAPPKADGPRLVTIGSAVTEIVFALGAGERVVAADKSSQHPEQAAKVATLPYFRQVGAEGVLSLSPTLVLAGADAGPAAALEQIEGAGVKLARIAEARDADTAKQRIKDIAMALGADYADEADALVARLDADLKAARDRRVACNKREARPRALFVYARGPGMLMVGGAGTAADVMLGLADAENAASGVEGFKPLTAEAVVAASPEVIVFTTRGFEGLGGADGALKIPGVAQTPAGAHKKFAALDDLKLLGMGPRMGEAARELIEALHECP